jgi:hypothetical protein
LDTEPDQSSSSVLKPEPAVRDWLAYKEIP